MLEISVFQVLIQDHPINFLQSIYFSHQPCGEAVENCTSALYCRLYHYIRVII